MILEAKTRSGYISYDLIYLQLHCFCGCVQRDYRSVSSSCVMYTGMGNYLFLSDFMTAHVPFP